MSFTQGKSDYINKISKVQLYVNRKVLNNVLSADH